jgi:hypothetical protein
MPAGAGCGIELGAGQTYFEAGRKHRKERKMTTFDDRERAEEAKFAHDQEMQFRVHARRNRLLGMWAAERMSLSAVEAEAYAKGVVQADFEESGDEDVVRKLLGDLVSAGVEADEGEVRTALRAKDAEARRALMGEV